jgi:AcrR family transcriptional regulator
MTPKLSKEYSDLRKRQILMAGWECFIDRGYGETTVREIAKRMNASTGVIYNYFKGKEEILEGIQEWSIENNKKIFSQMSREGSVRKAMKRFFENNFECGPIEDVKRSIRGNISVLSEGLRKQNIRAVFNSSYGFMVENLSRFFRAGKGKKEISSDVDPTAMAGFFIALLLGVQLQLALIDRLDTGVYIENIKKILFANVWTSPLAGARKGGKDK